MAPKGLDIPDGLVGDPNVVEVYVDGAPCLCLLDTGSQVTCIAESFFRTLPDRKLKPLEDLEVTGAGGQEVPYLGFTEIDITIPKKDAGVDVTTTVLALVCPDGVDDQAPLLMGTNTSVLRDLTDAWGSLSPRQRRRRPRQKAWVKASRAVIKRCRLDQAGRIGPVRLSSSLMFPMKSTTEVEGTVCNRLGVAVDLLIEPSCGQHGLTFHPMLVRLPASSKPTVKVMVTNFSGVDIFKDKGFIIGVADIPESVAKLKSRDKAYCNKASAEPCDSAEEVPDVLLDFGESPITTEWKDKFSSLVSKEHPNVVPKNDLDNGYTEEMEHGIRMNDDSPFREPSRRIPPSDYADAKAHIEDLLKKGIIRESSSPYASPIVLVRKKNGEIRLTVDYRLLNSRTIRDQYNVPKIEDTFNSLNGAKWFTCLDLKSGYYQVAMAEKDKPKTAFWCPLGFYEFNRMPQGITNAPATFQRLMERCMGDLTSSGVLVYLDDLLVYSNTLEEHLKRLDEVLSRLEKYGLKLNMKKCQFAQTSVKCLGHVVCQDGVKTDPDKIAAVQTWPQPDNVKELKSFLGFAGYYRRFIKDYSRISRPLNDLTKMYEPVRKRGRRKSTKKKPKQNPNSNPPRPSPNTPFGENWTPACEASFEELKEKLTIAPVLAFADYNKPFILHTDASTTGLGAALYQVQEDGSQRVVAYASRGLSKSEARYPAHKLEFCALKWAITEKFNDYLFGTHFTVWTDNNPLTYVLTTAKLDATGHRWLAALVNYDFDIRYKPGRNNQDADGLSRRPHGPQHEDQEYVEFQEQVERLRAKFLGDETQECNAEVFRIVCQAHKVTRRARCLTMSSSTETHASDENDPEHVTLVESITDSPECVPTQFDNPTLPGQGSLPSMTGDQWVRLQAEDPNLLPIVQSLTKGRRPSRKEVKDLPEETKLLVRQWEKLQLRGGVLYRKTVTANLQEHFQLVLPSSHRGDAFEGLHDCVGHPGFDRTLELVRSRFYWPKMAAYIHQKCQSCQRCVMRKAPAPTAAHLINIQTSEPMELLNIDFLSLEPDVKDTRNILVVTDHFTGYAMAFPTRDQKAKTVAKVLCDQVFVHYGLPKRVHTDQGRDFESKLIKEVCATLGIQKSRTTPYHPQGNGKCERFNRTLLGMLGTLEDKEKKEWREHVTTLVHAYNCTPNSTGYSPYYLMFGREPNLPVDIVMGLTHGSKQKTTTTEYARRLRRRLQEAHALAKDKVEKLAAANKQRYDKKVREATIDIGDQVLVRNVGLQGKHKLANRWASTIYTVTGRPDLSTPVYIVTPIDGDGPSRTLHRNMLLPCNFTFPPVEEPALKSKGIQHTSQRPRTRKQVRFADAEPASSDSESDDYDLHVSKIPVTDDKPTSAPEPSTFYSNIDEAPRPESPSNDSASEVPGNAEEDDPPEEPHDDSSPDQKAESSDSSDMEAPPSRPGPHLPPRRSTRHKAPTKRFGYYAPGEPASMKLSARMQEKELQLREQKMKLFAELFCTL